MILSKYYKCEICVVDIRTGRIDRFGEDCFYLQRVFIIYDGIHFDPLYLQKKIHEPDNIQTKFSTKDDAIMAQAFEVGNEAKKAKQFTDVNNFKLRCLVCQQPLAGQVEAQKHAEKTGHINFGEIDS
jgi:ubiquitin thioesterase OTU1